MLNFLEKLFDTSDFPARWVCGQWESFHGWLHIISDLAVWSAYFAIPFILLIFVRKRRDFPFPRIFWLFGAFILACGTVHLLEATIFWWPVYRLSAIAKFVTAIVSWATVFALISAIPNALSLRTSAELEKLLDASVKQLKESEKRLELSVRGTNDGLWDWNIVTGEVYYAPRFKELLGYSNEADFPHVFESFKNHLHPDDRDETIEAVNAHLEKNHPYEIEYRLRLKDGTYRWFQAKGKALRDESGKPIRMSGFISDVHDRKEAEAGLWRSNELNNAILNGTEYSVISTDTIGTIKTFNSAAEKILGYKREEVLGKVTPQIIHLKEEVIEHAARLSEELGEAITPGFKVFVARADRGHFEEREWTYVRKDGSHLPVHLSVSALRDKEGSITGYLGIAKDITDQKKLEQQLREQKEEYEYVFNSIPATIFYKDTNNKI